MGTNIGCDDSLGHLRERVLDGGLKVATLHR